MTIKAGYIFDNHKRMMDKLFALLDRAAVEYDADEDVVDDFTQYIKDWATRRSESILDRSNGI